jgi:hypothetical protein
VPDAPGSVQWHHDYEKGVRRMKKILLLLVLVAIGLAIAKQFVGDE